MDRGGVGVCVCGVELGGCKRGPGTGQRFCTACELEAEVAVEGRTQRCRSQIKGERRGQKTARGDWKRQLKKGKKMSKRNLKQRKCTYGKSV